MTRLILTSIAALLLTACNEIVVTWQPTPEQEAIEATTDCHIGVIPRTSGAVWFQLQNCHIDTIAQIQMPDGSLIYLRGPHHYTWAPNPRRIQTTYEIRAALRDNEQLTGTERRTPIGRIHYRW